MERKGPCPKMERLMPRPDPRQLWGKILDQRFPVDPLPIRSRIIVKPTEVPL